jgi:hypothetical protein
MCGCRGWLGRLCSGLLILADNIVMEQLDDQSQRFSPSVITELMQA